MLQYLLCIRENCWVSPTSPLALAFQMVIKCAGKDAKLECCSMWLHLPWSHGLQGCLQLLIWPLVPAARPLVTTRHVANQTVHPNALSVHRRFKGTAYLLYTSQLPSVLCTYLRTCGVSLYGFQKSMDSWRKFFALILSCCVNLVAPPLSANEHQNRLEQLREICHTLSVVGPWISLDGWQ